MNGTAHEDLMAAAVMLHDHMVPRWSTPGHLDVLHPALPDDAARPVLSDAVHLVHLADGAGPGLDVRADLLDVLARHALVEAVTDMATEDRTWLLTARATVVVNWVGGALDVRDPVDEAGTRLHELVYGWRFDQLTPGRVSAMVARRLAR